MLKSFDFECDNCSEIFEALVEGVEGKPDGCPRCPSDTGFTKLPSSINLAEKSVPSYPGCKRVKAGYQHTHNRNAEKAGRQISMYGSDKNGN